MLRIFTKLFGSKNLLLKKLNIDYCKTMAVNSQEILKGEVEFTGAK